MVKFFDLLFKNKRMMFFVLLFFVLSGIILPDSASAGISDSIRNALNAMLGSIKAGIPVAIITLPIYLIRVVFQTFASLSEYVFKYVLSQLVEGSGWEITQNPVFLGAWYIVKAWANTLIALGLIGIATAIILSFRGSEAKKMLPILIVVALLINFSVVFVGVMIDVSNLAMKSLLGFGGQELNLTLAVNGAWNNMVPTLFSNAWASVIANEDYVTIFAKSFAYAGLDAVFALLYI
ncbi:MAG: hypothetical protein AAB877_01910, partial [Patescibacteria group bacterium]